jgi:hypothetical protein
VRFAHSPRVRRSSRTLKRTDAHSRRRKWKRWTVAALVITPLFFLAVHTILERSDAFDIASTYLRGNSEVVQSAGIVRGTSLSWRGGAIRVSGDSGSAKFTVNVDGAVSAPRAYVELRKRGVWEVTFARLLPEKGEPVVLMEAK